MGKWDYYDEKTIMKKIKFFKIKKLFRISLFASFIPLITVFWCFIPKNCENSDFRNINVFIGILLLCINFINFLFAIKYCFALFYKDTSYSKTVFHSYSKRYMMHGRRFPLSIKQILPKVGVYK